MVTACDQLETFAEPNRGRAPKFPSIGPRYHITRKIKRGGMAEVFEAYLEGERGFRKRFAIKRPLDISDARQVTGFADEARILNQLTHPNILQVFDLGIQDGWPYQVLEYIDGLTLTELYSKSRIQRSPMSAEVALHIAEVVASALDYAHNARNGDGPMGIVHRDVSPQNILLSWKGEVKLIDFGIAFAERKEAKTQTGIVRGKLSFMAPEQLYNELISPRTDLFALGCVLHSMMLGQSPLTNGKARADITSGQVPKLDPALPEDIALIVERAIQPSPEARFDSGRAFAQACRRALEARGAKEPQEGLRSWLSALEQNKPLRSSNPFVELFQLDAPSALDDVLSTVLDPNMAAPENTAVAVDEAEQAMLTRPLTIGRFELIRALHPAGLGTLYLAKDMERDGTFFLKVIPRHALERQELIAMFFAEAAIFSHIDHDHLLRVVDFGSASNYLFMALERPEGRSFGELQEDRALSWGEAALLGADMIRALQQAEELDCNELDLSCRDIRPETIFIVRDGCPKLFDYALVSVAERLAANVQAPKPLETLCACLVSSVGSVSADGTVSSYGTVGSTETGEQRPEAGELLERVPEPLRAVFEQALDVRAPHLEPLLQAFEVFARQQGAAPLAMVLGQTSSLGSFVKTQPSRLCDLETELRPPPKSRARFSRTQLWVGVAALLFTVVGALSLTVGDSVEAYASSLEQLIRHEFTQ